MSKDFSFKNSNFSSADNAKYPSVDARFERLESSHNAVKADFANKMYYTTIKETGVIVDWSPIFRQKIEDAVEKNITKIVMPYLEDGYIIKTPVIIREGISLVCDSAPNYRRSNFPYTKVIPSADFEGDAMFMLESHASIEGVALYDASQKYILAAHDEEWVQDRPIGIQLGYEGYNAFSGNNVNYGNRIKNIAFIGILKGVVQNAESINVEALTLEGLTGMPLEVGIQIHLTSDVIRFNGVHFNINSYAALYSGTVSNYFRKVATTCEVFRFGRVDEAILLSCFAFGVKNLIHWYRDAYTGDSNSGGGVTLIGTSCDACHVPFQVDRSGLNNFSVKVLGGFFVPIVKIDGSERCMLKFSGVAASNHFEFAGVKSFGHTHPVLGDATASDSPEYHIIWDTTGQSNVVVLSGCNLDKHSISISKNESTANNNSYTMSGIEKGNIVNSTTKPFTMKSSGTDGPGMVFDNDGGTKYEIDNYGGIGGSLLRFFMNGILLMALRENGEVALVKNGMGFEVRSPDGVKRGLYKVADNGVPLVGALPLCTVVAVPATSTSTGEIGHIASDANYLYVCYAQNLWNRFSKAAW